MKTLTVRLCGTFLLLVVLFWGLPTAVHYFSQAEAEKQTPQKTRPLNEKNAYWNEQIRKLGDSAAYAKLLKESLQDSQSQQHLLGHIFGHELYQIDGLKGFSICGVELSGGCMHEFVGMAIRENGLSVLSALNQNCLDTEVSKSAAACQHGLGHGLVNYFGYEYDDLVQALSICKGTVSEDHIKGCYSGALMEFHSRTISGEGLRTIGPKGPFETCEQLSLVYKPACYFWTPQFVWESLYSAQRTTEAFAGTGSYCEKVPAIYRDYCFQGLGNFVPPNAAYDKTRAKGLCDAVSLVKHSRDTCWSEASIAFEN